MHWIRMIGIPSEASSPFKTSPAPPKFKLPLEDWAPVVQNSIPNGEEPAFVDRFIYLSSRVTQDNSKVLEVRKRIFKSREA